MVKEVHAFEALQTEILSAHDTCLNSPVPQSPPVPQAAWWQTLLIAIAVGQIFLTA